MKLTLDSLPMYCREVGDCLYWNLSCNSAGKPQARLDGQYWLVQRYVYTVLMDNEIREGNRVTTRCCSLKCISPKCLIQSNYSAILKRSYAKGKRSLASEYGARVQNLVKAGRTKLDYEKAAEIRASELKASELAELYGVGIGTINRVKKGEYWRAHGTSIFTYRP